MDKLARLTGGGDEVIPAAGDVGLLVEAEDVGGYGVAVMMVVKEPAVVAGLAEGGLNRFEVHGGILRGSGGLYRSGGSVCRGCGRAVLFTLQLPKPYPSPLVGLGQIVCFQCVVGWALP